MSDDEVIFTTLRSKVQNVRNAYALPISRERGVNGEIVDMIGRRLPTRLQVQKMHWEHRPRESRKVKQKDPLRSKSRKKKHPTYEEYLDMEDWANLRGGCKAKVDRNLNKGNRRVVHRQKIEELQGGWIGDTKQSRVDKDALRLISQADRQRPGCDVGKKGDAIQKLYLVSDRATYLGRRIGNSMETNRRTSIKRR